MSSPFFILFSKRLKRGFCYYETNHSVSYIYSIANLFSFVNNFFLRRRMRCKILRLLHLLSNFSAFAAQRFIKEHSLVMYIVYQIFDGNAGYMPVISSTLPVKDLQTLLPKVLLFNILHSIEPGSCSTFVEC